jgi:ribonuclease VapC
VIVVDSSVLVAIMRHEPDAAVWIDVLDQASRTLLSVVSYVETSIVIAGRRNDADPGRLDGMLKALRVSIAPVTADQGNVALTAFLRFGKGRHAAALNLGDCFAYGLAKSRNLPLLFKGDDFSQTDIVPAWRS